MDFGRRAPTPIKKTRKANDLDATGENLEATFENLAEDGADRGRESPCGGGAGSPPRFAPRLS